MSDRYRKAILEADVLELGDVEYAHGKSGNNILNFDRLFEPEQIMRLKIVAKGLGSLVVKHNPDLLIGVPRGGERFAKILAQDERLKGIPIAHLAKVDTSPGSKTYKYAAEKDEDLVAQSSRIVVVEDVFHELTSTRGVLAVPGIVEHTVAAVAVWDRGDHPSRDTLPKPYEALVDEYIKKFLREDDELYRFGKKVDG